MPTAARRDTTTVTATSDTATNDVTARDATAGDATTGGGAGPSVKAEARNATDDVSTAGSATANSVRQIIMMPATVVRQVADDVASTARRPDAVVYVGGLLGQAALGVLEWPVAGGRCRGSRRGGRQRRAPRPGLTGTEAAG